MKEILPKPGKSDFKYARQPFLPTKIFPSELDSSHSHPSWRKKGLIFQSPHIPADILTDSSWAVSFWRKRTDCLMCCWFLRDEKLRVKPLVCDQIGWLCFGYLRTTSPICLDPLFSNSARTFVSKAREASRKKNSLTFSPEKRGSVTALARRIKTACTQFKWTSRVNIAEFYFPIF